VYEKYETSVSDRRHVFLSRDPAKADENLYRYCGDEPLSHTDPLGEQYGPVGWLFRPYTMAVKKALKGMKVGELGIRIRIQLDMAASGKDSGEFSDMPARTIARARGFDTAGPENELQKIADSPSATVTYNLRCVVRWWNRPTPICEVDYSVALWADLTITPKTPPGPPIKQSDLWFTVVGHFDTK
jgi:hypothetical protein